MNYEKIINLLRNEKWWIVEGPCVLSTVYPPIKGFIEMNRYLKGYSIGIFPCKKRYTLQLLMEKESIEIADFLYKKHLKDRKYFQKRINLWKAYSKALTDYCQKIEKSALSKISNNSLIRMYLKLNELYIKEFSIPLCAEGTGIYVDAKVAPEFSKYFNINLSMAHDYILILSSPIGRSFIEEERIGFLKLCIAYYDKEKDFTKMLNEHSRKYFWIRNNYERTEIISPNDFLIHVKEETKDRGINAIKEELGKLQSSIKNLIKKKNALIKKISLAKKHKALFELLSKLVWLQDQRKKNMLVTTHYLFFLQKEISKRSKIPLKYVEELFPDDIKHIFYKEKNFYINEAKSRTKGCILAVYRDGELLLKGKKAENIMFIAESLQSSSEEELNGIVASMGNGNVIGNVRIVNNPHKEKFNKDEILVTSMTRHEFVPLMRKAKAIITNEGGITSHAAIVSRELGIPCIIGTKVATKALKNGDFVEVNVKEGIVRKIK